MVTSEYSWATADELAREFGGRNWVIHRRTRRIIEKYGADVICVTPKRYEQATKDALAKRKLSSSVR